MEIITNNKPRFLIYGFELTDKEKSEFDYLDDIETNSFFRYKKQVYNLGEFMRIENIPEFEKWHSYHSDSFFSGVLIKLIDDESILVGRYYS